MAVFLRELYQNGHVFAALARSSSKVSFVRWRPIASGSRQDSVNESFAALRSEMLT